MAGLLTPGSATGVQVQKTQQLPLLLPRKSAAAGSGTSSCLQREKSGFFAGLTARCKIYSLLQHEHRAGNSRRLIYHFLIYFSPCQKNLFIREGSGGSCPAFPQYHADNRRKQNPLLCLEPPAPLITLPKFSSGSPQCSFNLCHSCCLSFHPASNRHNQGSLEEPLLAYSREPSAPWNEGSTADNQEKMHRCSKTQRVSIREPSSLFRLCCIWTSEAAAFLSLWYVLLASGSAAFLCWMLVQGLRCLLSPSSSQP